MEIPWNIYSHQQQPKNNALLATVTEQLPCEGEVQEEEESVIEGTDIDEEGSDDLKDLIADDECVNYCQEASSNAMEKASLATMEADPVEKIIKEQFSKTGAVMRMAHTTGTNMQGIISLAIQHPTPEGPPPYREEVGQPM